VGDEQTVWSTNKVFDFRDVSFTVVTDIDVVVRVDADTGDCRSLSALPISGVNLRPRLRGEGRDLWIGFPGSHGSRIRGLLHREELEGHRDGGVRNRALVCDPVVQLVFAGQVEVGGARGDGLLGKGAVQRLEEHT